MCRTPHGKMGWKSCQSWAADLRAYSGYRRALGRKNGKKAHHLSSELFDFPGRANFDGATVTLVVGIANGHANVHVARAEMEVIVRAGVNRKPITFLDVLAIGAETRKNVFIILSDDVRDSLAIGHDDLKIGAIDPHTALEIALFFFDDFGANVKDIARKLIDLLAANVSDVVFGKLRGGEDKGLNGTDVIEILFAEHNALEGVLRGVSDLFEALALGREDDIAGHTILAIGAIIVVDGLDGEGLGVGVVVPFLPEFGFALGKTLDDVLGGDGRRLVNDGIVAGRADALGRRRGVIGLILRGRRCLSVLRRRSGKRTRVLCKRKQSDGACEQKGKRKMSEMSG